MCLRINPNPMRDLSEKCQRIDIITWGAGLILKLLGENWREEMSVTFSRNQLFHRSNLYPAEEGLSSPSLCRLMNVNLWNCDKGAVICCSPVRRATVVARRINAQGPQ